MSADVHVCAGESGHLLQLKDTVQHLNRQLNTSEEGREQVQRKLHKLEDHSTSLKRYVRTCSDSSLLTV